jgi:hypothetical protein
VGWSALAVIGVILIAVLIGNGNRLTESKVSQQAINVAFAERAYYQQHGVYTADLSKLAYRNTDSRIKIEVFTDPNPDPSCIGNGCPQGAQHFCVDARAISSIYEARTWQNEFSADGRGAYSFWGNCGGTYAQPSGIPTHSP